MDFNLTTFSNARTYRLAALLVGGIGVLITLMFWDLLNRHNTLQIKQLSTEAATILKLHFEEILDQDIQLLLGLAKRWEFQAGANKQAWLADASYIVQKNKSFQAIEWVDPSFHVRWVTPLTGNEAALNLNLGFETRRKRVLQITRNKKNMTISQSIELVQGGRGFLVYVPIFVNAEFQGFILGIFRIDTLLAPTLHEHLFRDFHLNITENEEIIYSTKKIEYQTYDTFAHKMKFDFKNLNWTTTLWPKRALLENRSSDLPIVILLAGLLISMILSLFIYFLSILKSNAFKLKEKSDELEFINQGSELIAQAVDFNDALQACLTLVCTKINWKVGHAYVLKEVSAKVLTPSNIWYIEKDMDADHFCEITRKTTFGPGIGLPGRIWASRKPAWIQNIQTDPNFPRAQKCSHLPLKGAIGFPILAQQHVIAILEFFHTESIESNTKLLKILQILGEHIGALWEKRQAENLLKLSEQKNRTIIETAMDSIIVINSHGIIQECNSATCKIFKYEMSDLLGKNVSCLMPLPEKNKHNQYIQKYLETGKANIIGKRREVTGVDSQNQKIALDLTVNEITLKNEIHLLGVLRDITETVKIKNQLFKLAHYDYLTNLPNRSLFDETLKKTLDRATRNNLSFSLLYLDLDGFKKVNDSMGHTIGDLLLQAVSKRMQEALRTYDFISRLSGDEFAVIIQDISDQKDACFIADKLIHTINQAFHLKGYQIHIGISIGIAHYSSTPPHIAKNANTLVQYADQALYAAKQNGRNQYQIYQDLVEKQKQD